MKNSVIALLFSTVVGLLALSSHAAEFSADALADDLSKVKLEGAYRIEVCTIPLIDIINVIPFVKNIIAPLKLQHMFVRGINGDKVTGLNFEPKNKQNWMGSESMIGEQDYKNATSAVLFSTDSKDEFELEWAKFIAEYDEALKHPYNVLAMNCQKVTQEVLKALKYKMPEVIETIIDKQSVKAEDGKVKTNDNNCAQQ